MQCVHIRQVETPGQKSIFNSLLGPKCPGLVGWSSVSSLHVFHAVSSTCRVAMRQIPQAYHLTVCNISLTLARESALLPKASIDNPVYSLFYKVCNFFFLFLRSPWLYDAAYSCILRIRVCASLAVEEWCLVTFPVTVKQATLRRQGLLGLTVQGYSLSQWRSPGGRSLRGQLIT